MSVRMNCEIFQNNLNAFLDSELSEEMRAKMIEHAMNCPECGERLDQMTRLLTMCAEMDEGLVMPLDGQAAWRNAIREEVQKKKRPKTSAWMRSIGAIAAALVLLVSGTAYYRMQLPLSSDQYIPLLGGQQAKLVNQTGEVYDEGASYSQEAPQSGYLLDTDGSASDDLLYGNADSMDADEDGQQSAGKSSAIVIRRATRDIETSAFDSDARNIEDLIDEYEGYFEQNSQRGQILEPGMTEGRTLYVTVRVPSEKLDDFLVSLSAVGTTTYSSESAEDISSRYYDTQARLDVKKEQHTRLKELIAEADSLTDIIELENKLYEVQADIDSIEGQLRGWNSQASLSSVDITMTEVAQRDKVQPITDSLGDRVKNGFYDSVNWLMAFLQDMAVFLAVIAPQLVIIIPLVILIVVIIRIVTRRRRNR